MKTKIEWRHGARVLKLDDTDYDVFPEDGDVIELQEDGETYRFEVQGVSSAVVVLELAPDQHSAVTNPDERTPLEDVKTVAPEKQQARQFKVTPKAKSKR